jgi:uncharacterized protein involved in exopolysaccharide biosynthesis
LDSRSLEHEDLGRLGGTRSPGYTFPRDDRPTEVAALRYAALLLRSWWLFVLIPLALALPIVVSGLLQARTYTAVTSFVPQLSESSTSRLSTIAAQFGVDVGVEGAFTSSPPFYGMLVLSDEILRPVVETPYQAVIDGRPQVATLEKLWAIEGESPERTRYLVLRSLRNATSVDINRETGLVRLAVSTEWPSVSLGIVNRVIELVNDFNLRTRRDQAAAEQAFVNTRLGEAERQLRQSEDVLQAFLQRNRSYQGDPSLTFQFDRLRRDLEMKQSLYSFLRQAVEQTRLDAARNTPTITVVERATLPAIPDPRGLSLKTLLALLIGGIIALLAAVLREGYRRSVSSAPAEHEELRGIAIGVRDAIASPFRRRR